METIQQTNKYYRNLMLAHPIVGPIMEMWRDLAFHGRELVLSHVADQKTAEFYYTAVVASGVEKNFPHLFTDYMGFGKFVAHLIFDDTKGYWTDLVNHDLDAVSIKLSPLPDVDPIIDVLPTEEMQQWAVSLDPRVIEQRKDIDPVLCKLMAAGKPFPLAPENTLFLARKQFSTDYYGTSFLWDIDKDEQDPKKILKALMVDVGSITDDTKFKMRFVYPAERVRDSISDYVLLERMFPTLARKHGFRKYVGEDKPKHRVPVGELAIPHFEWEYKHQLAELKSIVVKTLESIGVPLEELC